MRSRLCGSLIAVVVLTNTLLIIFQASASPAAKAASTIIDRPLVKAELPWEGYVWERTPAHAKTFEAPAEAVYVEIVADWGWSGLPNQNQGNEEHEVRSNGQVIKCIDMGNEELDGLWLLCGSAAFEWSGELTIKVIFTGDNSSPGSHKFRVRVNWYGDERRRPAILTLDSACLTPGIDSNDLRLTGQLLDQRGEPMIGQEVKLYLPDNTEAKVMTDAGGKYEYIYVDAKQYVGFEVFAVAGEAKASITIAATDFEPCLTPSAGYCEAVELSIPSGSEIPEEGTTINVVVNGFHSQAYRLVRREGNTFEVIAGPQVDNRFEEVLVLPNVRYQGQVWTRGFGWTRTGCEFSYSSVLSQIKAGTCTLTTSRDKAANKWVNLGALDENGNKVDIDLFKAKSNFSFHYPPTPANVLPVLLRWPGADEGSWFVQFAVSADNGQTWLGGPRCRLEQKRSRPTTGQYQDFVGPVAFGTYTPYLEPGKDYFDGTRSLMFNVEYFNEAGQGDIVFRFNGQEVSGVAASIFHGGTFSQIESVDGRASTTFDEGVTKLIAYQFGAEQARIFQTMTPANTRWIHPLDQPFEHKYEFVLEVHGPPGITDLLIYSQELRDIQYDENGLAVVTLTYSEPGLVAIYSVADLTKDLAWVTVEQVSYPIATRQRTSYDFGETGLYHYRIMDHWGRVVAGPVSSPYIFFDGEPGLTYYAQLAYPETSVFVGLYDDMKFKHPDYWTMPVDARYEHAFEFHLDYYRQDDPDLDNDHIRGDVVVDALYLINGTTSVAQQFPHGRHDGVLPGVTIVGIPTVSMIAFCQRPGVHEVVYWGGWENESYYLPDRGWTFDQILYNEWNEDRRGDCIDAARRVNMELARQGLRTDHTYRHHGQKSQGYQMTQLNIWSPYNLVGMRPPHIGQFLKPGTVLPYYEEPEDLLFWGWDLDKGGLADGLGAAELQAYVSFLGPVVYGDQTGIHPPEAWIVPELPTLEPPAPGLESPPPTPEPPSPVPAPSPPTPESPTPTPPLEPPILIPQPPSDSLPPT